jgi:hypothetical protein
MALGYETQATAVEEETRESCLKRVALKCLIKAVLNQLTALYPWMLFPEDPAGE